MASNPNTNMVNVQVDASPVATGASAPKRVILKSPKVQYVKSRFAHRAAIRQWKLSRLMLATGQR